MPAVITDQIRVLNATNFVSGISTTANSYYVFIGLPNATSVASDWNTNTPSRHVVAIPTTAEALLVLVVKIPPLDIFDLLRTK